MQSIFKIVITSVFFNMLAAYLLPARVPCIVTPVDTNLLQHMARQVFAYTNQFRIQKGQLPLIWSDDVARCAAFHSEQMATHQVSFGHAGFASRLNSLPQRARASAENVYTCNHRTNQARLAVDGWIASPGHCKNMLGNYTHCGVAICYGADGYWYFTQIFARF